VVEYHCEVSAPVISVLVPVDVDEFGSVGIFHEERMRRKISVAVRNAGRLELCCLIENGMRTGRTLCIRGFFVVGLRHY